MRFTPKTEQEIQEANLLPEGKYDFEVIAAEEKQSAKGNDMIVVTIAIYQNGNRKTNVFDYLLESMAFKLRHFCQNTGLIEKYESGELTADDCIGKTGLCKIKIQKDKSGNYPDKNVIADYLDAGACSSHETESDIPF